MLFDDDYVLRSREIQLRRERAERELKDARERQRIRLSSVGSASSVSCESTPRRCLSPSRYSLCACGPVMPSRSVV